jgi:hypothetical protein
MPEYGFAGVSARETSGDFETLGFGCREGEAMLSLATLATGCGNGQAQRLWQ